MEDMLGIVIPFVGLDRHIGRWRKEHVYNAKDVPAHVTLLIPARNPPLEPDELDLLGAIIGSEPPFTVEFTGIDRFGDNVLYLVPEDNGQMRCLHDKLVDMLGRPAEPYPFVPHLTVAFQPQVDLDVIQRELEECLRNHFPISEPVNSLSLWYGSLNGRWRCAAEFELGHLSR